MGRRGAAPAEQRPHRRLASGAIAEIVPDEFSPDGLQLVVDGTAQSHVYAEHNGELFFEYIQRMGHVIDLIGSPGSAITAIHLGAGALTLPRYVEATRPGSRQQVIELEPELVGLVREALPLPKGASIRVRYGDARAVIGSLPPGLTGAADLVVVDIFAGARTPAHVTSVEFYQAVRSLVAPAGVVLVNVADGGRLDFARSQAATLDYVFDKVIGLAETGVAKGRRFGNIVFAASTSPFDSKTLQRLNAAGPFPGTLLMNDTWTRFAAGGRIVTDLTAVESPAPPEGTF